MPRATASKSGLDYSTNGEDLPSSRISVNSIQLEADPLIQSYRKLQWLKKRVRNLKIAITVEDIKEDPIMLDENELIKNIIMLQNELYEETNAKEIEGISVISLQLADTLSRILASDFEEDETDDTASLKNVITDDMKSHLRTLLIKQVGLSSAVLSEIVEMRMLKDQIHVLEVENSNLISKRLQAGRKHYEEINAVENRPQNETVERLQKKLKKETEIVKTVTHILQSLISHSRLNWAKDESLRNLVCDLGKNLDDQLDQVVAQETA